MTRGFRLLALLLAACVLLPGCATVRKFFAPEPNAADAPASSASAPAGPPSYELEIVAPDSLKPLLQQNLDLARFRATSDSGDLTRSELDRLIAAAPAQARALLETEGYFQAQITAERDPAREQHVRVSVAPGTRASIESVSLDVDGALQKAADAHDEAAAQLLRDWRAKFLLKQGQPFRQALWGSAKTDSLNQLRAQGYAAAQWTSTSADVDVKSNSVKLSLKAESGPLFHAGDIVVRGLQRQDDRAVRNLAGFQSGAVLTEKLLLDYQERLQKLGLYDRASVSFDPDPEEADAATVTVRVHEQQLQQATIGLGYSANTGQRASLEHTHRRPFGQDLIAHNKFEIGRDRQAWEGEISTHPGKDFWRNLIGGATEHLTSEGEQRNSAHIRLGRAQETQLAERMGYLEFENAELRSADVDQRAFATSLNYQMVLRRLDSIILPTDGYSLSLQGGVGRARSNYAEAGPFVRTYGRLTFYKPLGHSWYGQARVEAGQVFARDSVGLPDTKLFRAGGDDSVRGYEYRSLGPLLNDTIVGGRVLFTGSLEVARPFEKMPSLWYAAFFDAGQAADQWKGMTLARGYGLGLRWRSPVGPLRVDVAYGEEVKRFRLHFSVGIAF